VLAKTDRQLVAARPELITTGSLGSTDLTAAQLSARLRAQARSRRHPLSDSAGYGPSLMSTVGPVLVDEPIGGSNGNGADGTTTINDSLGASVSQDYGALTNNCVLSKFQAVHEYRNPAPSGQEHCDNPSEVIRASAWDGGITEGPR